MSPFFGDVGDPAVGPVVCVIKHYGKVVISLTGYETEDKYRITMAPLLAVAVWNLGF